MSSYFPSAAPRLPPDPRVARPTVHQTMMRSQQQPTLPPPPPTQYIFAVPPEESPSLFRVMLDGPGKIIWDIGKFLILLFGLMALVAMVAGTFTFLSMRSNAPFAAFALTIILVPTGILCCGCLKWCYFSNKPRPIVAQWPTSQQQQQYQQGTPLFHS